MGHDDKKSSMMNGPFAATPMKAKRRSSRFDAWQPEPQLVRERRLRRLAARTMLASAMFAALGCSDEEVMVGGPGGAPTRQGATDDSGASFILYLGQQGERRINVGASQPAPEDFAGIGGGATLLDESGEEAPGLRNMGIDWGEGETETGDLAQGPNPLEVVEDGIDFDILTWGAAMQCAKEKYEETPYAAIATVFPRPWVDYNGEAGWYHFLGKRAHADATTGDGGEWTTCEDILYHQELTYCIAEKLHTAANTSAPLTWDAPADCGSGAPPWSPGISCTDPGWWNSVWTVPPQGEQSAMVARDAAIRALAHVALFEFEPVTYYDYGDNATVENCALLYERVLDDPAKMEYPDGGLREPLFASNPVLSPQYSIADQPVELVLSRLQRKADVLTLAGDLLEKLLTESIDADKAIAGAQPKTLQGLDAAWGGGGHSPGYKHAMSTILGRIEDYDDYQETWLNPARTDHAFNQLDIPSTEPFCAGLPSWETAVFTVANGVTGGTTANGRWLDTPPSNSNQTTALMLLDSSGIVIPLNQPGGSATDLQDAKDAIADQLLYDAAGDLGLNDPDEDYQGGPFRDSAQAQALVSSVDEISTNDWEWALGVAVSSYQYLTQWNLRQQTNAVPNPSDPPGGITVAPMSPLLDALNGVAIEGGMPLGDISAHPMSLAAIGQEMSQCSAHELVDNGESCTFDNPGGCSPVTHSEDDRVQVFQNVFMLGDVMRRRLVGMSERIQSHSYATQTVQDAADNVAGFAAAGGEALRLWASQGRMLHSRTDGDVSVWLLGLRPEDFGLSTVEELQQNFVFVYGKPWVADCAAGIRETCPTNFESDYVQPYTLRYDYSGTSFWDAPGDEGLVWNMVIEQEDFKAKFNPSLGAEGSLNTTGNHLYLISKNSADSSTGFVVGAIKQNIRQNERQTTMEVISARQRDYVEEILSIDPRNYASEPEPPPCAEVPDDFFVPLENELTSDSDAFESSWRHYLTLAEQAAARADELGREIVAVGKEIEGRREQASEELAGICGDFGTLDDVPFEVTERGTLDIGDYETDLLDECVGEEVAQVVFLTTDPFEGSGLSNQEILEAIQRDFLGCQGENPTDDLCSITDPNDLDYQFLGLAESTYVPSTEASCFDAAVDTVALAASNDRGAVVQFASRPDTRIANLAASLAGITLRVTNDVTWDWELRVQDTLLMSTTEAGYWPYCREQFNCDPESQAAAFDDMFSVQTNFNWDAALEARKDAYFRAVARRLWMLGAITGYMPPGIISMPIPAVNWGSSDWTDAEKEAGVHTFTLYGWGYFIQEGSNLWLDTESPLLQESDRWGLGPAQIIDPGLAGAFGATDSTRGDWMKAVYGKILIGSNGDAYLHVSGTNAAVQFRQLENRQDDLLGAYAAHSDSCVGDVCEKLNWDWEQLLSSHFERPGSDPHGLPAGEPLYTDHLCSTADDLQPILQSDGFLWDMLLWTEEPAGKPVRDPSSIFSNWPYNSANNAHLWYSVSPLYDTVAEYPSATYYPFDWDPNTQTYCPNGWGYRNSPTPYNTVSYACALSVDSGNYKFTGNPSRYWFRNTAGALGPSNCGPDKRLRAFSDGTAFEQSPGVNPTSLEEYRVQVTQAVALACAVNDRFNALPSGAPLPVLSEPSDLGKYRAWLKDQSRGARNALTYIALRNIPQRVVDDFKNGLVGVGDISGELGQQVLNLENDLRSISNNWVSLEGDFDALANAVDGAQLGLTAVKLQASQASIRLSMERMQNNALIAKGIANAAGGIAKMTLGIATEGGAGAIIEGANQTANSGIDIALGLSLRNKLNELAAVEAAQETNQVAQVVNDLEQLAIPTYTNMRTTLEDLRIASAGAIGSAAARQDLKQRATYAAAKGIGAQFFRDSEGEVSQIALNTVLGREYDAAVGRYQRALQHAQRMAYVAKLAIEQRLGVRMRDLTGEIPGYGVPADWENDMCNFQGIDYDDLRTGEYDDGSGNEAPFYNSEGVAVDPGRHEDAFIGDYVEQLRQFVEYYNLNEPMHEEDDMTVLSLRDDLIPPQGTVCYDEGPNLLHFSSALGGAYTQFVEGGDPEMLGWSKNACTVTDENCLYVSGGQGLLDASGAAQALPPATGSGGISWLRNAPLEVNENIPPAADSEGPSRSVFQSVDLQGGVAYTLSWWDMARGIDGDAEAADIEPYAVELYDASWNLVSAPWADVPHYEGDGGIWSERRVVQFTPSDSGEYRIVFRAADGDVPASVLIANVQLERSLGSNQATAYVDTSASRLVLSGDCMSGSPQDFRDAFEYHCDGSDDCWYDLKSNIIIDTSALWTGESRLRGKLARGNFNYRHVDLAVNVVGTGVLECDSQGVESCYGSGYVEYTLEHDASAVPLLGQTGTATVFDFGTATIPYGKALATERYLTLPLGSADQGLISQLELQKTQLNGRPLNGQYRLKVHDSPALEWGRVEDIQLVIRYRYWSEVDNGAGPGF